MKLYYHVRIFSWIFMIINRAKTVGLRWGKFNIPSEKRAWNFHISRMKNERRRNRFVRERLINWPTDRTTQRNGAQKKKLRQMEICLVVVLVSCLIKKWFFTVFIRITKSVIRLISHERTVLMMFMLDGYFINFSLKEGMLNLFNYFQFEIKNWIGANRIIRLNKFDKRMEKIEKFTRWF